MMDFWVGIIENIFFGPICNFETHEKTNKSIKLISRIIKIKKNIWNIPIIYLFFKKDEQAKKI